MGCRGPFLRLLQSSAGYPQLRPCVELLEMHLTLPPSAGFSLSHFLALINSSPPHPVRKQVCAELGPGPELGLSMPLLGLRGRRWGGGGGSCSVPTLVQANRQENPQCSPQSLLIPTLFSRNMKTVKTKNPEHNGLVYDIYKRPASPPCASLLLGSLTPLGPASLLPAVECKSWPRLEVWESQPPQDW